MLNESQQEFITKNAYLPEHLPAYFVPFSDLEPHLAGPYVYYAGPDRLSFIGYPLDEEFETGRMNQVLNRLVGERRPAGLRVIAPETPAIHGYRIARREQDCYFRLDLAGLKVRPKVHNTVRRAGRELVVTVGRGFTVEHQRLLVRFIRNKALPEETAYFFHRLPDYLAHSETAFLVEARTRDGGALAAYDVVEFGTGAYCFYLFNITNREDRYVPGTSDLLLAELIRLAREQHKRYLNLGLGINPGVEKFKSKWGAGPFLEYRLVAAEPKLFSWRGLFAGG